jgi:hypothetical protein
VRVQFWRAVRDAPENFLRAQASNNSDRAHR